MQPLSIEETGGVVVARVGDGAAFNESQAGGLRQALYDAFGSRPAPLVALDLARVDYLSSSGIAMLIGAKRRVDAAEGRLVLFNLDPDVLDLFHSMKLTALFEISPTEAEALSLLATPATS
jgi:anti-sigma B factor antagonist